MSINRSVSRSKEIVYTVETKDEVGQFHAVIDDRHILLVTFPGDTMSSRRHTGLLDDLLKKAKARDGIADHQMLYTKVLKAEGKELLIVPADPELRAAANALN
ncbi:hypothetical protein pEaSNUABM8_00131 [Erwinia phage pEa_SNUABM_8]|nr:hypothetical protein pEaSNUABM8_00131 [Erwinia phage pEa_SNUABM_8]QVW54883.1 hypothetical protein pEaSNUABM4_00130 [Erwinia phage pEa_SNUABM_4]